MSSIENIDRLIDKIYNIRCKGNVEDEDLKDITEIVKHLEKLKAVQKECDEYEKNYMNWRSADSANAFHRILDIFRIKN
jgi:hypothetical protein